MTEEPQTTAYLALGSNLGDRRRAIEAALGRLAAFDVTLETHSRLYETDPVTPDPQPRYLNAAARVRTALSARALLEACLAIERALGRVRPPGLVQAPRVIDIDLLLYGAAVIDAPPDLIVPHPRLLERPFVRIPLADVAVPGLVHPVTGAALDHAAPAPDVRPLV